MPRHTLTPILALTAAAAIAVPALADHQVIAHGTVLFSNVTTGPLVGVPAGTSVTLRFVLGHTPNIEVPNEVSEYEINFADTSLTVGAQTFTIDPGALPPALMFENDNTEDSGSDGIETHPDVVDIAGTGYQMRIHAHNILGNIFTSADLTENAGTYQGTQFHHLTWSVYSGIEGMLVTLGDIQIIPGPTPCDTIDFNGDTLFPDTQDITDFLTVFAGGVCNGQQPNDPPCNTDIDFNNDDLFPDVSDIDSLLSVFAGGECI